MRLPAFLLGFACLGSQVLLTRQLVAILGGNELIIGAALFGWLFFTAAGAFVAGRRSQSPAAGKLIVLASLVTLGEVVLLRFAVSLLTATPFETIIWTRALVLAASAMAPPAFVFGWAFVAIARRGWKPAQAVPTAYLWEGIGAFASGIAIALLIVFLTSDLGVALWLTGIVGAAVWCRSLKPQVVMIVMTIAVIVMSTGSYLAGPWLDHLLDSYRYDPFQVQTTVDTPYGHHTLLEHDDQVILLSDNRVEGVYPDQQTAEELLIPALLHHPDARRVLLIGRGEMGLQHLLDHFPDLEVAAVDPRSRLSFVLDQAVPNPGHLVRLDNDPLAFWTGAGAALRPDILLVQLGDPGSYLATRLVTVEALRHFSKALSGDGLLLVSTPYDTERYVSPEASTALRSIYGALTTCFDQVWLWPGSRTVLFASQSLGRRAELPLLNGRMQQMPYQPKYLREDILADRLESLRTERLNSAMASGGTTNTGDLPRLLTYHLVHETRTQPAGPVLAKLVKNRLWLLLPAGLWLLLLIRPSISRRRAPTGVLLFSLAGWSSLMLELLVLYLYQNRAGALYGHISILLGCFMLGLAVGTHLALQSGRKHSAMMGLVLLAGATLALLLTHQSVEQGLLAYYGCFLFTQALATGVLFVGAGHFFYGDSLSGNYGSGYAIELAGSAAAAALTLTVILPSLGVTGCLLAVLIAALASLGVVWRVER